jgi:alanyl-tRNA synthetase
VVRNLTLIAKILPDKTLDELRKLAIMIRSEEKIVIVLGAIEGKKLSLVVGCSNDLQIDARELLRSLLEGLNGRGGGDQFLAQGGCIVPVEGVGDIFKIARDYINNQPEPAG